MCMSLEDKPKQKQNTPSGSNGTNPKGGAVSSGLSKKDIDNAIKILDQEKQKLDTEIKKERQNLANQPNDTSEKEPDDENIEDKQDEFNKDSQDPTIEGDNSETQEKQELPNLTTQVSKDGSIEEKKNEKSTEKENKTDNKKVANEEDQETFDDKSNFVDPIEADPNGIIANPDYIDYAPTGNATEDAANRAEIAGLRQKDERRKEDANQRRQDRIRQEEEEKQEKQDRVKDEIFDEQWDDYQNGKRDTAPTRNEIDDEYTRNRTDKELGRQSDDTKPSSLVNNSNEPQLVNTQTESQQLNDENNLSKDKDSSRPIKSSDGSSEYMDYAPTGDKAVDDANQANVDRLRQQRAEDEKRSLQEKEEKANSKVEDQQWKDYTDGKSDNAPAKEGVADQRTSDQEKNQSQNNADTSEKKDSNTGLNTESDAFGQKSDDLKNKVSSKNDAKNAPNSGDTSKTGDRPKLGNRLSDAGNKLNAAKNIAQDPGGAAKKAAEDKLKEYAQKAAREAAKRAAQMAAKAAQAAAQLATSAASSIGTAIAGAAGFLIPVIIAVVLFIAIFSAVLVDAYCTPRPVVRGIIEYALTGDQKNLIQAGDALPIVGSLVAKFGNVVGTKSELYKQVFYNKGGICPDKIPDKCATGSGGTSGGSNVSGTYGTANGKVSVAECAKLKEYKAFIDEAANDYSLPAPFIGAILSQETEVGLGGSINPKGCEGRGDIGGRGHGLGQVDQASGAFGNVPIQPPRQFPVGTKLVKNGKPLLDKKGKQLTWSDCRDNIMYVAFHLDEVRQACKNDLKGPNNSSEYLKGLANGYNRWCGGVKNENITAKRDGLPYGTSVVNRAADVAKCFGEGATLAPVKPAKVDDKDNIDKLIDRLAVNINDTNTNSLKATITNQVKDRLSRKDENSQKSIDKQQTGNILTRILGGLDVEAAGTPGSFTYSGEDATVIGMITSGKIKDVITAIQPSRGTFKSQVEKKVMEPNSLKGLISVVNSGKFDFVQISSAYRAGDNVTSGHGSGQKFDIDALGYKGKTYTHQSGNDGDTASVEAFYELAKTLKDTGVLVHIISGGKIFEKISGDSYLSGTKIIRDDRSSPKYGAIHENHYDLRFNPNGTVGSSNSGSSNSSNGCPCGNSNGSSAPIGSATGDGTISKGGDFTPEIRAFLDVLAEEEVPKEIHLKRESYFAGNQIPAKFTEAEAKEGHPGNVGGKGSNVGRYQFNQGDYNDAKADDSRIKDYGPEGQDLVALYKLKYRKVLPELQSGKIEDAFEVASAEWESVVGKNDTILTGGSPRRGQKSPTGRTMAKQVAYYNQRLAVYKASSFIETADKNNKLAQLQTGYNESKNILDRLLNGIEVNAAYGTKPTSFTGIQADPKYVAFLKEIADTRGYEQYKDAGGKNSEMETALSAMVAASGGKLRVNNTYRSYQDQVGTYFRSGGGTGEIKKYWSPNLTPDELKEVRDGYLARGKVSAPPGYSQHSTGLAVDFNDVDLAFEGQPGYTFLKASAETFGFKESYPKGTNKGAGFEPWHWQFVGNDKYKLSTPLSSFQIGGTTTSNTSSSDCQPNTTSTSTSSDTNLNSAEIITKLEELVKAGKITGDGVTGDPGSAAPPLIDSAKSGKLNSNTAKVLIQLAEKNGPIDIMSVVRGDSQKFHPSGIAIDLGAVTYKGIKYSHYQAFQGNTNAIAGWIEAANTLKTSGLVRQIITAGSLVTTLRATDGFKAGSGKGTPSNIRIATTGGVNLTARHEDHYHIDITP